MWEFFINKSKFTYLVVFALVCFGLYSVFLIPRESSPEVQIPIGIVTTVLPGAPAADVESLVTNEIERGLLGALDDVKEITSSSREGVSVITVEFDARADIDESIDELKDAIDTLKGELPGEAEDPFVSEVNFVDQPILTFAVSGDASPREFLELAERLEDEIEGISGISRVEYSGVGERAVSVVVEQSALVQYGVSLQQITSALRSANTAFPIGQIENNGILYNITFDGKPTDLNDIENVSVAVNNGQPVYVRDVATVKDTVSESPAFSRLSVDGKPSSNAISFSVYKQRGGDITRLTSDVQERLAELGTGGGVLSEFTIVPILDSGADIKKDLVNLSSSGLQTVILVVLVLIIAIGWREAFVAGLTVPLSFLIGFIGLYLSGNTINFLSLFALILGIGILVDSGIVMVEGINRRMKENPNINKQEAARLAVREFASPLTSGTLTTVAMFAGLFIVTGVIGEFIKSIPFTLIFILFASLFVALAVVPVVASVVLRRRSATNFEKKQIEYTHRLESWYRAKLSYVIGHARREKIFLWSIRALLIVALALPFAGLVKVVFFEQGDIDYVFVDIELPQGSTKEITDLSVRRVEEVLYKNSDIESFQVTVGGGNQFVEGSGSGESLASFFILLKDERENTSSEIITNLRVALQPVNDVKVVVSQPNEGPPTGAAIGVTFVGDDLDELVALANEAAIVLSELPETTNIRTSIDAGSEFVVVLDTAKAASFGLDAQTVSGVLRSAVFGTEATTLNDLNAEVPVDVKLNIGNTLNVSSESTNVVSIDALRALVLPTQDGSTIPLSAIAEVRLQESRTVINHEDGSRVVSVQGDITPLGNARGIQTAYNGELTEKLEVPASVTMLPGGETGESDQAFVELFVALAVGITLMVAVLVFEFNSFRHMRYVISILPYSLIGIMFGLAITQNALSFPSIMGFIALSGIVVNNSILLIDMMNYDRKQNPGKAVRDVVIDSSVGRLRPILLTTVTTVIGMVPLTYSGDLWAPLAYAVMFGLIFSVIITLVLVPITYNRKPGELG